MPAINLMPPPAFEKSLVPAFQTNFNRIREALLRTSSRVAYASFQNTGPWPQGQTVNHPFKCDCLVTWGASCFSATGGMGGMAIYLDGTIQSNWAVMYFNEANSHKHLTSSVLIRGVAAGNHSWFFGGTGPYPVTSDANDFGHMAINMLEVTGV